MSVHANKILGSTSIKQIRTSFKFHIPEGLCWKKKNSPQRSHVVRTENTPLSNFFLSKSNFGGGLHIWASGISLQHTI